MILDLSMLLDATVPLFGGERPIEYETCATLEAQGWRNRRFTMHCHLGTHVDAPAHMLPQGRTLDTFPADYFVGTAAVVHCPGIHLIHPGDLPDTWGADFVLFHTGHSDDLRPEVFFGRCPEIVPEAAEELVRRGLRIVGIDSFTLDLPPFTAHKIVFAAERLGLENLVGLGQLPDECRLMVAPLKLDKPDGAPARVYAEVR